MSDTVIRVENLGKKYIIGHQRRERYTTLRDMMAGCQVTNQSSHGELSFHHNPHPSALLGLAPFTSRVIRSEGARMKNAAHLHTVIVVSYAR